MTRTRLALPLDGSRRRFVKGLAGGGALLIAGARNLRWASSRTGAAGSGQAIGENLRAELAGTDFNLDIGALGVNFTGASRIATAVNGQIPAPLLRWREGTTVTLRVTNRLST